MSKIEVNTNDLTREFSLDMYQTYTSERIEDILVEDYNEEHNTDYTYDDFNWEYDTDSVLWNLAWGLANELEKTFKAIHFVKPYETGSPKEYNYTTDWAQLLIDYDEDAVNDYIKDHDKDFNEFLSTSGWRSTIGGKSTEDKAEECMRIAKLAYYLHTVNGNLNETILWHLEEIANNNWYEYTKMTLMEDK